MVNKLPTSAFSQRMNPGLRSLPEVATLIFTRESEKIPTCGDGSQQTGPSHARAREDPSSMTSVVLKSSLATPARESERG